MLTCHMDVRRSTRCVASFEIFAFARPVFPLVFPLVEPARKVCLKLHCASLAVSQLGHGPSAPPIAEKFSNHSLSIRPWSCTCEVGRVPCRGCSCPRQRRASAFSFSPGSFCSLIFEIAPQ